MTSTVPAGEPDMSQTEVMDPRVYVREINVGGRRLCYVDAGRGPTLLLVHGLGASWQSWWHNIPALAQTYRVIAVDLPGFGGSEPLSGPVDMARLAEVLAQLLSTLGLARATVIGHSMGGVIAQELTLSHPELVERLMLVSSVGLPASRAREAWVVASMRSLNRLMSRPKRRERIVSSPRLRRALLSRMVHDPACVSPALLRELAPAAAGPGFRPAMRAARRADTRLQVSGIACPTIVVWGRQDRLLPVWMGEQFVRLIPGARLTVWHKVGHCPMLERPQEFNAIVREFATESS